jgi:hypothetical protein
MYVVWDAGKETGDVMSLDTDYTTKKVTIYTAQSGVKAVGLMHLISTEWGYSVISPGKREHMIDEAKAKQALHDQEATIEATAPINWVAS